MAEAIGLADEATVYDNSSASEPFRVVAPFERGLAASTTSWPRWTPNALRAERVAAERVARRGPTPVRAPR